MADKIKYTPQQQNVLDDSTKNLLVSASAGSGKTATVIQKIFDLITKNNIDLQELLVITFTESASLEMKMRLKDKLYKASNENISLSGQIEKLPTSDISTIHGFCSKMLRKYFFELDLNANFAVLNENDSKFLKATALDKIINKYSNNQDDDFIKLSMLFGGRNFSALKSNILSYYEFLCAVENKEIFKNNIAKSCYNLDLKNNPACDSLNKYILSNIYYLTCSLDNYLLTAQVEHADYFEDYIKQLLVVFSGISYEKDFEKNRRELINIDLPKLTRQKLNINNSNFKQDFKPFLDNLQKLVKELKSIVLEKPIEEVVSDLNLAQDILNKFQELENDFEKEYESLKQRRNALDFSDLEQKFLILLNNSQVCDAISNTYKYIFVDEYQDINSVQELILSKLLSSSNMVMVGDIKQSIYGFRNSTPSIFVNKSVDYLQGNTNGKLINLNENFRSNPQILNFVNSIFNKCMFVDFGGVDYYENGQLKGMTNYQKVNDLPIINIDFVNTQNIEEQEELEEEHSFPYSVLEDKNVYLKKLTTARKEAMLVAKHILNMVGKSYYDAKEEITKIINFGDIAILSRGNEFLKEVSKVLIEYKIPIATNMVDNIYKNKDVSLLVCLLKIVNNIHDDISLSVVLTSVLCGISFDELGLIREKYCEEEYLYESVNRYFENEEQSEIKIKLAKFFDLIKEIRGRFIYDSIYDVLNFIEDKFEYLSYLNSLPDGANRYKVVKNFIDSFYDTEYNYDLNKYLDFVNNFAEDARFSTSLNASPDSVKLGTIHSSKGLEYPIVFLVGCGKTFSNITFREEILKDKDFGLGINTYDLNEYKKTSNLARNAIILNLKKQEKAEELRLLYVALTRAKNHLFIVGHVNLKNINQVNNSKEAESVNNFMPWIISGLTQLGAKNLKSLKSNYIDKCDNFELAVNIYNESDFVPSSEKDIKLKLFKDNFSCEKLSKLFNYSFEKNNYIALKNTVSSMLQEHSEDGVSINIHPKTLQVFESKKESIDASRLGTIYHDIMQKIDFFKNVSLEEINKIIDDMNLDEKYKKHVSSNKILVCFNKIKSFNLKSVKKELPFLSYVPYNYIFKKSNINDKILIQGVADLIVDTGKEVVLIDYKTTKTQKPDHLVDKYKLQLELYKMCLEKALNISISHTYIYSYYFDDFVKII